MKSPTFSIFVRLATRSGKSFTAGYRIGWETNPQAVCHSLKAEAVRLVLGQSRAERAEVRSSQGPERAARSAEGVAYHQGRRATRKNQRSATTTAIAMITGRSLFGASCSITAAGYGVAGREKS